jgi:hypothetical protein
MCFEVAVRSERFTDMACPAVFGKQLDGFIVQHIFYTDGCVASARRQKKPDNAMELTWVKKHISDCGGFLVDFERVSG